MIYSIKGKVVKIGFKFIVIETEGVGYKIHTADQFALGSTLKLFTFQHVKEDDLSLFGFKKEEDLEIFELLLAVSGVGPKMALAIVSGLGKAKIIQAISTGDTTLFKTVTGVGNKLAGKIIIELKNKISKGELPSEFFDEGDEVIDALKSLGFKKDEIMSTLKEMPESFRTTQEKVKFVLKNARKRS